MGRCCVWETCHYLRRRRARKAFRRWRPGGSHSSIGVQVSYPSIHSLANALRRDFELDHWRGIGLFVPPSYVDVPERTLARLAAIDRRIAGLPLLRALADHRLLVFIRR
jgi:hypothetical protein